MLSSTVFLFLFSPTRLRPPLIAPLLRSRGLPGSTDLWFPVFWNFLQNSPVLGAGCGYWAP